MGVSASGAGPRLAAITAQAAIQRYGAEGEVPALAQRFGLAWAPTGRASVGWTFRTGPGGAYHALSLTDAVALGDAVRLTLRGAAVPYHQGDAVWRLAGTAGGDLAAKVGDHAVVQLGGDASSDAVWALDLRAFGALTLEWR
ncbi:MAG: hypothetical protein R3F59_24550 [Myxococcota bacterium]